MRVLASVLSLLFISELVLAGPLGLPDSARPGAVRPQPEVMPEPSVEPSEDMVDIPAVIDRPFDIGVRLFKVREIGQCFIGVGCVQVHLVLVVSNKEPEFVFD